MAGKVDNFQSSLATDVLLDEGDLASIVKHPLPQDYAKKMSDIDYYYYCFFNSR